MNDNAKSTTATIIPSLRYSNAPAAIDWLCDAFGFEKHLVVRADDGSIAHAQLTFGNGMIMLGSARDDEFGRMIRQPSDLDGGITQSPYVVVNDVDAHHERAKSVGARIVMEPEDQPYGGRLYTCRDIEDHLWSFGSYDPWQ